MDSDLKWLIHNLFFSFFPAFLIAWVIGIARKHIDNRRRNAKGEDRRYTSYFYGLNYTPLILGLIFLSWQNFEKNYFGILLFALILVTNLYIFDFFCLIYCRFDQSNEKINIYNNEIKIYEIIWFLLSISYYIFISKQGVIIILFIFLVFLTFAIFLKRTKDILENLLREERND